VQKAKALRKAKAKAPCIAKAKALRMAQ